MRAPDVPHGAPFRSLDEELQHLRVPIVAGQVRQEVVAGASGLHDVIDVVVHPSVHLRARGDASFRAHLSSAAAQRPSRRREIVVETLKRDRGLALVDRPAPPPLYSDGAAPVPVHVEYCGEGPKPLVLWNIQRVGFLTGQLESRR
jgi:hypothetical protein